jgi:solute carrier family 25 folate transporter 32
MPNIRVLDSFAGAGGGVVCTLVCSPLDVAKTRLQVQGHVGVQKYNGLLHSLRTIWFEEGMKGLYRGLEPSLFTVPMFWALYFPVYNGVKEYLHDSTRLKHHEASLHCVSAITAAFVADVISNPLWVVRTRMMTDIYHGDAVGKLHTFSAIRYIYVHEGIRGLFKGLSASLLGLSHVAIQFPIYEEFKRRLAARNNDGKLSSTDLVLASAGSKFIASSITYPHEVIRSRLQDWRGVGGFGMRQTIVSIAKREGLRGFYQGYFVNLARVLPACVSTFVSYEFIRSHLKESFSS